MRPKRHRINKKEKLEVALKTVYFSVYEVKYIVISPGKMQDLKIPHSWTVIIHFMNYYILCALLTYPETVPTFYLPQNTVPSYPPVAR
jgi:hypothetical protein